MPRFIPQFWSVLLLAAAACVDAPTGDATSETGVDPLALTFEQLAAQAAATGDVARAEGFGFAAIAARSGITPTSVNVRNGTTSEVYDAFVNSVEYSASAQASARIPAHRTVTAWRRGGDGVTRILSLTVPGDSAPVLNPASLSITGPAAAPFAGASGLYQETTRIVALGSGALGAAVADEFWIATSGYVRIREASAGIACPVAPTAVGLSGTSCRQARFTVRFDVAMQRLSARPYAVAPNVAARRFTWTADQTVTGFKLTFNCATVTSTRGCG